MLYMRSDGQFESFMWMCEEMRLIATCDMSESKLWSLAYATFVLLIFKTASLTLDTWAPMFVFSYSLRDHAEIASVKLKRAEELRRHLSY